MLNISHFFFSDQLLGLEDHGFFGRVFLINVSFSKIMHKNDEDAW